MTIDCSKLKVGDVCITRGGEKVIYEGSSLGKNNGKVSYLLRYEDGHSLYYYQDGQFISGEECEYDIVAVKTLEPTITTPFPQEITKRDFFAAFALMGIIAKEGLATREDFYASDAERTFKYADAMMKAREVKDA
jgi:hypothetical protein